MNPAGGLPSLPPAYPAFSLLPCPLSPSPFPNGEGEIYGYFMQGASPLASPGLSPSGAGSRGEPLAQKGACPVDCRLTLPPLYLPGGGLPSLSPAAPAFSLPFCPHPPSPLPLRGRGSPKVYFAGGFAPGTPALNRLRHVQTVPNRYPAGGLPSLSPATPAFSLLSCPHPPNPLPRWGRGRPRLFHARGFAPCIPGTEPMVRRKNGRKRFPARVPPGLRSRGAGGGSPRRNKVKVSPFPAGEERSASAGWGDREQESKLKAGAADNPNRRAPSPLTL